jgi:hypothetical protein
VAILPKRRDRNPGRLLGDDDTRWRDLRQPEKGLPRMLCVVSIMEEGQRTVFVINARPIYELYSQLHLSNLSSGRLQLFMSG